MKLRDKIKAFKIGLTQGFKEGFCDGYQDGFFVGGLILCFLFSSAGIVSMEKGFLSSVTLLIVVATWFIMVTLGWVFWKDRHDIDKITEACKRMSGRAISVGASHFKEELRKELEK